MNSKLKILSTINIKIIFEGKQIALRSL